MNGFVHLNLGSSLVALGALLAQSPVNAQTAPATTNEAAQPQTATTELSDIVVTAERRSSSVQRTGLAISAFDEATLKTSGGVLDARDLAIAIPSVHVASLGLYTNVYVHGVGGGVSNPYGSPAVAYSLDGVFIDNASGPGTAFYDLARLEVVKGPQGTLYGRNATAGALNLIPNRPTAKLEASLTAQYGNYNDIETEGMLNVPLSATLKSRIAFKTIDHDGYLSNGANDAGTKAIRAQLLWDPTTRLKLLFSFDFAKTGQIGFQSVPLYPGVDFSTFGTGAILPGVPVGQRYIDPGNKWRALDAGALYPSLILPPYPGLVSLAGNDAGVHNKQYVAHVQADLNLDFATLTVIPAFVGIRNDAIFYQAGFRASEVENVDQYSLEARLASNSSGALKWIVGGYFFHSKGNAKADFFQSGVSDITLLLSDYASTSKAVFAQATYAVVDRLRLTAGVRYTSEQKSETGQTIIGNIFLAPPPTPATCSAPFTYYAPVNGGQSQPARCGSPSAGRQSFDSVDYKFGVEADIGPHSLLYLNASSGFKAGGFNPGTAPNTYPPERLTDFDGGIKNRFFDNRLQLNLEAFYWIYKNQQAQAFGPINPAGYAYIVYPSKSHIYGAAVDFQGVLGDNDKINGGLEYQIGKYDSYQTLSIPQLGVVGVDGSGENRPFTPKWTGRFGYTHSFNFASGARVDLNANTLIQSSQYISTTPKEPFSRSGQEGYHKSNASLTWFSDNDRFTVGLYVNNLENTFTLNSVQLSTTTGNTFGYVDSPRTYGLRVGARF